MLTAFERTTGLDLRKQWPALLIAVGHGSTHWIIATFYVLVPYIREDLGLSYAEAGIFASVFFFSSFFANVGSGAVVDITGRRILIQSASLVIGGIALMAMGFANNSWIIIAMLIFIGGTNNLWHPAAISHLSALYPSQRGYVLSIHTLGASIGDMAAPLIAGFLLVGLTWKVTAVVTGAPIAIIAVLLYLVLSGGQHHQTKLLNKDGIESTMSRSEYIKGIFGLIHNRPLLGVCLMAAFRSMAQNGLLFFLPLLILDKLGFGPILLGLALTALQLGGSVAGPIAGMFSDRVGRRKVVLMGLIGSTLVIALVPFISTAATFVVILSVLGFTLFSVRPVIHSWSMDLAPKEMSGSAISLLFGAQAGFSIVVPIAGGQIADIWGLDVVFFGLACCMVVASVTAYMLPKSTLAH